MVVERKNILEDEHILNQYVTGVKLLKNETLTPGWNNTYDIFVVWHHIAMHKLTPGGSSPRNAAHVGPSFLPWHRWMLILLEYHLQRVLEDPNFGLPYWDWAATGELPPNQQPLAPIWSDECMGGSGAPVRNGPFAEGSWSINMYGYRGPNGEGILVPVNRGLERELGEGRNGSVLPTKAEVRAAVNKPSVLYDTEPWDRNSQNSFRNDLEGWAATDGRPRLHNLVHVFVGGDMGASTSPNDPIFFLNHCNVDRIWGAWQKVHNSPPYLPDANAPNYLLCHRLNDSLEFINIPSHEVFDPVYRGSVTPADLLDTSTRYVYDTFSDLL